MKSSMMVGDLHKGLRNMSPPADSGMRPTNRSVNDGATRGGVAASPKTVGPREA